MNDGDSGLLGHDDDDSGSQNRIRVRDISDNFLGPNQDRAFQYVEPLLQSREQTYTSNNRGSPQKELSHTHGAKELKVL